MAGIYRDIQLTTESDVEQKFVYKFLITPTPSGLGFRESDIKTKNNIKKLSIDKGGKRKLYFPDYAVVVDGIPALIVEAKAPGEDLEEALREARLYAHEINAQYPNSLNPCSLVIATDGDRLVAGHWDQANHVVDLKRSDVDPVDPNFQKLVDLCGKKEIQRLVDGLLRKLRTSATYWKPVHMLGGKAVANETVGENSFGANVSVEYKYLFNPESMDERAAVVKNAYVTSTRKLSHVAPIDKIVRAAIPPHVRNARQLVDLRRPDEITSNVGNATRVKNELCLLIGSVGSGKSTFTDFLRLEALPGPVRDTTGWVNINLNTAPLTREKIYTWIISNLIAEIQKGHTPFDFDELTFLNKLYSSQIAKVEKGKASLFVKGSERWSEVIFEEINRLQSDLEETLRSYVNYFYKASGRILIIVLDNCDKRNREDQLLMFEVATWLKTNFHCMVFLPIRDTTYDQYKDEPPLDTVIKDLVFRIDPPLLERVIYSRLNYAIREIAVGSGKFTYYLPNSMRVECARSEVGDYLKSIIASLFQDEFFKRTISGLAGRNIRKGLEILLDFCKSGHISEVEILKIRSSGGDYKLPNHIVSKILLKGKRRYYYDADSNIKNVFASYAEDPLPNPFVRLAILQWLRNRRSEYGPNRTLGFHSVSELVGDLQGAGFAQARLLAEVQALYAAECIVAEAQCDIVSFDDLISLAPSGYVHLDLVRSINYLSAVSEDVLFRENEPAKTIADNLVGKGKFPVDSKQSALNNAKTLVDYLVAYRDKILVGDAKIIPAPASENLIGLEKLSEYVSRQAVNGEISRANNLQAAYPIGSQQYGQIVSVQDYGFFVEFGTNGSGLVHKRNFGTLNADPGNPLEAGDWVIVELLSYTSAHHRFDLKLVDR